MQYLIEVIIIMRFDTKTNTYKIMKLLLNANKMIKLINTNTYDSWLQHVHVCYNMFHYCKPSLFLSVKKQGIPIFCMHKNMGRHNFICQSGL